MRLTAEQYSVMVDASMRESELEEFVRQACRSMGRPYYHPRRSERSVPGFPDDHIIVGDTLIVAELKTMAGKLSREQEEWLEAYRQVQRVEVHVWRPSDRDRITSRLSGEPS